MRQVLIDHARGQERVKRGGKNLRLTLDEGLDSPKARELEFLDIEEAIGNLSALDSRRGTVCALKLFGQMTFREVGEALGISPKTVEADWYFARAWLRTTLR